MSIIKVYLNYIAAIICMAYIIIMGNSVMENRKMKQKLIYFLNTDTSNNYQIKIKTYLSNLGK